MITAREIKARLTWAAIFVASLVLAYGFGCVSQASQDEAQTRMEADR